MKIGRAVRPGRRIEKKGKDSLYSCKKSQSGNILPIWGEASTAPIETKICVAGNLTYVITCAKFQGEIFRGYDFTWVRMSYFLVDFCMGLTTAALLRGIRDLSPFDMHPDSYLPDGLAAPRQKYIRGLVLG